MRAEAMHPESALKPGRWHCRSLRAPGPGLPAADLDSTRGRLSPGAASTIRECEADACAAGLPVLCPDTAAVCFDESPCNRESNAGAGVRACARGAAAPEPVEHPSRRRFGQALARILHRDEDVGAVGRS